MVTEGMLKKMICNYSKVIKMELKVLKNVYYTVYSWELKLLRFIVFQFKTLTGLRNKSAN